MSLMSWRTSRPHFAMSFIQTHTQSGTPWSSVLRTSYGPPYRSCFSVSLSVDSLQFLSPSCLAVGFSMTTSWCGTRVTPRLAPAGQIGAAERGEAGAAFFGELGAAHRQGGPQADREAGGHERGKRNRR